MKKIFYINELLSSRTGARIHGLELMEALNKRSVLVQSFPEIISESNFATKLRISPKFFIQRFPNIFEFLFFLKRTLRIFFWLPLILLKIIHFHPDVILIRQGLHDLLPIFIKRFTKIPIILEVNSPIYEERISYYEMYHHKKIKLWKFFRKIDILTVLCADGIYAVSEQVASIVRIKVLSSRRELTIRVIPNGVNLSKFQHDPDKVHLDENNLIKIGFIGSLQPWHGVKRLINVVANIYNTYPNIKLYIAGDGTERESLERMVSQHINFKEGVVFEGRIVYARIPEFLLKMDILSAPYDFPSSFYFSPLKLFEYMAAGKAIITVNCGQIKEILTDHVDGILVEPTDNNGLEKALIELIRNPDLRSRLGMSALKKAQQYTWDRAAKSLTEFANEISAI